ncbi:acyltransferase [Rhizobium sp. TRM95111]|uniref:acyltransferase family protein n=1 Tax=Rhizobium alarense TaxID=2846851 RepID=UPI001F48F97A|nr:acyltransferase [Rhizobium alarense]MCF3638948.1 acyltransferase [Rhizobium alarense]
MTYARAATSRETLYGVQYLRGLAALAVVLFHAAERSGHAFAIGAAGVDVFFVISGFIMWIISARRPVSPGRFLAERLRRIVPVYWLATSVMLAGAAAGLFPNLVISAGHTAASLLFLPMRSPSNGEIWPVLVQGWTLNFEMFFYLVFAAALVLPARFRLAAVAGLFASLVAAGTLVDSNDPLFLTYTSPIVFEFVAGMAIGRLWLAGRLPPVAVALALVALSLAGFAALWLLRLPFDETVCGPLAAALVLATVTLDRHGHVPKLALPALIGNASYSIYLWHTFAISVVAKAGPSLGLDTPFVLVAATLLGTGCGILAYVLVERPLAAVLRPRPPERRDASPAPNG